MSDAPLRPPEYLSPSSLFTYKQCPAKFRFTRIDGLEDPPGIEALRGSFVHEILETLYRRPAADRTLADARAIAADLWPDWQEKARHLLRTDAMTREFRWQAWWAVENLYRLEDPTTLEQDGIEEYVEGLIDGVKIRGYIDRWAHGDTGIVIGDYKTGKTPKPKFQPDKFLQLAIYALLLLQIKQEAVERVELIYLKHGDRLVLPADDGLLQKTQDFVVNTAAAIQQSCDEENFETVPSILCDWCAFKTTICPYWNRIN